jgi:FkbM family methyltransferase
VLALLRELRRKLDIEYRLRLFAQYVRRFGLRGALATRWRLWSRHSGVWEVAVPGLAYPLALRPGTADANTFEKIFVWNDYDLQYPDDVKTVIDAGANIGLSAVFFAARFPKATILAIEPEHENLQLLKRNTAGYPGVVPLHAALWGTDTTLGLTNAQAPVDSYRYAPQSADASVEAFSVPSILARHDIAGVDVMKIDIEGAEAAVFAGSPPWVEQVGMFIVELHGDEARENFAAATAALPAVRYRRGEDEIVRVR